jgi:hypothetical protein
LSTYRREAEVQALLESWSRVSARALLQKVTSEDVATPNEALVAVARAFMRSGATEDAWRIIEVLSRRVAGRTYRHLSLWGIAGASQQEDITRDILHMMIECVLSTDPQNEFWECRFWTCFDRRVRTLLRDFASRRHDNVEWNEDVERAATDVRPLSASTATIDWTDNIAAKALLDRLPEPLRTAFYLKHYAGYKEESADGEPTIASTLGVSGRTVRNYLRRAELLLAELRGDVTSSMNAPEIRKEASDD